ncbi:CtsR family transcriptional regulator [Lacticaseibacillus suilingensis]|jgi:transcriptional regulator CtsR|uniref:Transcriptional regulator CtsR n=1 Tax=Lacticaseibacillus suilingensis TaxID=2799577 RepID=A0ABW4BF17_9LACO|nr:CtsR family transcriptional regulator [Lacticaseibacillus suilingensis]MCI2017666.1 CtsR family transcriptional regulator [Lactobacillus sp.]
MQGQNISDVIEHYLKAMLGSTRQVEISRAEIAQQFNCVPSQINYVIKTRFTPQRGYVVESKRGGGGYIRILKVHLRDDQDLLAMMVANMPPAIRERDAQVLIQQLYDADVIDRQEGNMMLTVLSHHTLQQGDRQAEDELRSRLLLAFLASLRYER